jgi:hypothetical protein
VREKFWALLLVLAVASPFACAVRQTTQPPTVVNDGVPEWVRTTKLSEDKICAVGSCEQTFYQENAKPCAADNAREALAKSVSVQVQSIMLDVNKNGRQSVDSAGISSVSGYVSDTVLREAIISQYWYDAEGKVLRGATYALACIPKSKIGGGK